MKEILTSTTSEATRKMNELKDEITLMHISLEEIRRLSRADHERLARLLQKIDDPSLQELLQRRPFLPGVIAETEGDKIFFKSTYSNIRNPNPITAADFEKLEKRQLQLINAYEQSMENKFEEWFSKKSEQKPHLDPVVDAQLREIVKGICSDWRSIVRSLGHIGRKLDDHYTHIVSLCQNEGFLDIPHYHY